MWGRVFDGAALRVRSCLRLSETAAGKDLPPGTLTMSSTTRRPSKTEMQGKIWALEDELKLLQDELA